MRGSHAAKEAGARLASRGSRPSLLSLVSTQYNKTNKLTRHKQDDGKNGEPQRGLCSRGRGSWWRLVLGARRQSLRRSIILDRVARYRLEFSKIATECRTRLLETRNVDEIGKRPKGFQALGPFEGNTSQANRHAPRSLKAVVVALCIFFGHTRRLHACLVACRSEIRCLDML